MENKEIKIVPPPGFVIDKENSTFECIKFKPKQPTYKDIAEKLFDDNKKMWYISYGGEIRHKQVCGNTDDPENATSKKQCGKLLALNKLINVAKYLNDGWEPNFCDCSEKYYLYTYNVTNATRVETRISIAGKQSTSWCSPCFKSLDLAKQAIEILGEETVKLALSQV